MSSKTHLHATDTPDSVRPVFKIGINCDGDAVFNKDPKDPNKYECEGSKTQVNSQQMSDYLLNLCKDHPLLEYVEDPFAENDSNGYRILKNALSESCPTVKIGLASTFKDSKIEKVQEITKPKTADQIEKEQIKVKDEEKRPPTNEQDKKKGGPPAKVNEQPAEALTGKLSFTPHVVNLRTGPLPTMS